MRSGTIRAWYLVHKWTSLACTAFLLLLCCTGLPLIFHEEIDRALGDAPALRSMPDAPLRPLDDMVRAGVALHPGERPLYLSFDEDRPVVNVTTAPRATSPVGEMRLTAFDRRTARPVGELREDGVMAVMLRLHVDLYADQPGKLFLGFMGLLFLLSLVSGTVVYAPFMRKLAFGTVRTARSRRVRWIDRHNMIGIVTLAWAAVVGLTGAINTLAEPLTALWRADQLAALVRPYAGQPPISPAAFGSLDAAVARAMAAAPGTRPQYVAFPGVPYTSAHHYAVWLKGATPATSRLLTPALVDARTGALTPMRPMPWYMLALGLSQPLHFGDYGGLPLKILWALLDLATIAVLGSGLYLWLGKRSRPLDARVREVASGGLVAAE